MGDPGAARHEPAQLAVGEMDRVREHAPRPQPTGPVVDIEVVGCLGEQPCDRLDLAGVLGQVGLPDGAVACCQRGRLSQHLGAAADREPGRECVAQTPIGGTIPALTQRRRLTQASLQPIGRGRLLVVAQPIHHHRAKRRPDAVRLRCPEGHVEAVGPDGAVRQDGGRAGRRHGLDRWRGTRRSATGARNCRSRLKMWRSSQVSRSSPAPDTRSRHLWQVHMQVDHARQQHHGPQVDDWPRASDAGAPPGPDLRDAAVRIHHQDAVRLVSRAALRRAASGPVPGARTAVPRARQAAAWSQQGAWRGL